MQDLLSIDNYSEGCCRKKSLGECRKRGSWKQDFPRNHKEKKETSNSNNGQAGGLNVPAQ